MRTVVIASKNWYTTFYRACQGFLLLVFVYHYFKDWKHIRNFQSVSWNTLWSIEKKYSVNHDRIIIRSGNSSCRDNFVITCPFAQDAISSMHGQNHCGILHYSFTFSQRLTEHKARARFERSWKVQNEFGWWHF